MYRDNHNLFFFVEMEHAMMYGDLNIIKCFASGEKIKQRESSQNDDT
jgi:hypothetical protein